MPQSMLSESPFFIPKIELDRLIRLLIEAGYHVIGPSIHQGALAYEPIDLLEDIPAGYSSEEGPGWYRLRVRDHQRLFEATPGSDSWKRYLFPPRSDLYSTIHLNGNLRIEEVSPDIPHRLAFLGVRPCDLAAIQVLDRTFLGGPVQDPIYRARREELFIVSVNCTSPGETCFCASMGTGPTAGPGYDLNLTELDGGFLVESGSKLGNQFLSRLKHRASDVREVNVAQALLEGAKENMSRTLDTEGLPEFLLASFDNPHWDEVAERCFGCTNCTIVCPTCFCWTVEDRVDLSGEHSERDRVWDSCFSPAHSYTAGGRARPDIRSRYRQWLTHKLGSWVPQFGVSGCVGCGRCITWCPAEIDITEEIRMLRSAL